MVAYLGSGMRRTLLLCERALPFVAAYPLAVSEAFSATLLLGAFGLVGAAVYL